MLERPAQSDAGIVEHDVQPAAAELREFGQAAVPFIPVAHIEEIGVETAFDKKVVYRIKPDRSEEHTSELQSLMRISYAVFCLKTNHTILIIPSNTIQPH